MLIKLNNIFKIIFNPDFFHIGSDIETANKISEDIFYKKFKKKKFNNFCKTIFVHKLLKNKKWLPKLIKYNNNSLEIYTSYCGKLAKINCLPNDWKNQLRIIKEDNIKNNILIKDWGLWELNPYILNNLCIKNNKIYFIDLGDTIYANNIEINNYFEKKIRAISYVKYYGYYYLFYHYIRRIIIMLIRIFKKYYTLMLIVFYYNYY